MYKLFTHNSIDYRDRNFPVIHASASELIPNITLQEPELRFPTRLSEYQILFEGSVLNIFGSVTNNTHWFPLHRERIHVEIL